MSHIACFDFNLENLRVLSRSQTDLQYQSKVGLVKVLEKEVKLRLICDELKQQLVQKAQMDLQALFEMVDTYEDGVWDPDK